MFAEFPPHRENTVGARWNPPEVPAIYTSLSRDGALAEAEHQMSMQPRPPKAKRTLYLIVVKLNNVVQISGPDVLASLGISGADLQSSDPKACQNLGGIIERLGHDGLIVPSARTSSLNLVIFPNRQVYEQYRFEVIGSEVISAGDVW
jgi:RES domain-containing protein